MRAPARREEGAARGAASAAVVVGAPPPGAGPEELQIAETLARSLGLSEKALVTVRAGGGTAPATVRIGGKGATVAPGAALAQRLTLARSLPVHARYDRETATLSLGPFVGILALRTRRGPLYGDHDPFFRALVREGRALAIPAFVFSPRDVDWERERIAGYVRSARGGAWRRRWFPLPDVVYDRVQTRRAEAGDRYARFRRRLRGRVRAWFNETGFFDKWRLHVWLRNKEGLRPYLPETRRLLNPADLEHMLAAHPVVYVKPVAGSLGLGIVRVVKISGGFAAAYEIGDGVVTRKWRGPEGLHRFVSRIAKGRPYIVQQGLPLARWRGRPFDVRVLLQRGGQGDWAVTKMFSRIAARGAVTSNLTRGADACNIHLLLRRIYGGQQRGAAYRRLHAAGLHCAREIAAAVPGLVGELGLDLGLSRGGRIWLIEANSKPFLQMTRESGSARALALSVRRPLLFAKHLLEAGPDAGRSDDNLYGQKKERTR